MPEIEDLFPDWTTEDAYDRLVADLPAPPSGGVVWETREGSALHAILFPTAVEEIRLRDFARDIAANLFLWWCTGIALDAKGAEFGLTRNPAQVATGTVTFTGVDGTSVPLGTIVSTEAGSDASTDGVSFATVAIGSVTGGYVDIPIQCIQEGADGNVPAGSIMLLDTSVPGITAIQNAGATFGGADYEDDDSFRQRAIVRAALRPQGGNKDGYVALALLEPDIAFGYVEDLWNIIGPGATVVSGVGSARLHLSGNQVAYILPPTIDQLQSLIDPSVQILAHFESPEVWTISSGSAGTAEQATTVIEGGGSWRVHPATSATTEITRTLADPINLSGFGASTDEWWIELIRTTAQANFTSLKVMLETGDGLHKIERAIPNGEIASTRVVWTTANWTATVGNVASALAAVKVMRIRVQSSGSGSADVTVDSLRARNKLGGRGDGLANVGIQVTVRSGKFAALEVSATLTLDTGIALASVNSAVLANIQAYFDSLRAGSLVRLTGVANAIHDTFGVLDYASVQIRRTGGGFAASNIQLTPDERPTLGTTNALT